MTYPDQCAKTGCTNGAPRRHDGTEYEGLCEDCARPLKEQKFKEIFEGSSVTVEVVDG